MAKLDTYKITVYNERKDYRIVEEMTILFEDGDDPQKVISDVKDNLKITAQDERKRKDD